MTPDTDRASKKKKKHILKSSILLREAFVSDIDKMKPFFGIIAPRSPPVVVVILCTPPVVIRLVSLCYPAAVVSV